MKQYRHQPGRSSRIYYLLTVRDDGAMMLEFHGTDRTLTEEASVNADGWIVTKGAMYPPLDHPNGRWQEVEHTGTVPMCESDNDSTEGLSPACETTEIVPTEHIGDGSAVNAELSQPEPSPEPTDEPIIPAEQNNAPAESQQPKANSQKPEQLDLFAQMQMQIDQLRQENDRLCNMIQTEATRMGQEPSVIEDGHRCSSPRVSPTQRRRRAVAVETPAAQAVALEQDNGSSQLLKALGIAAASIVALVIIYNTGLLIPMGLIGLGASGLLK